MNVSKAKWFLLVWLTGVALIFGCSASTTSSPSENTLIIADQGYFHVGGSYQTIDKSEILVGQMYVWYQIPKHSRRPYPVVLVHGGGQTGTNFLQTPDGRPGWAEFFLQQGYTVYVIDWPGHGKSNYVAPVYGPPGLVPTEARERRFTAPKQFADNWPQAQKHTQWPGSGRKGDPIFDHFLASQSITPTANVKGVGPLNEKLTADALIALLDKIGPAIVLTHSMSGKPGWLVADARPKLVKAMLAVEPNGPPFHEAPYAWGSSKGEALTRPWGLTAFPVTYDPPVKDPSEIKIVQDEKPDGPGLIRCYRQAEPARRLINLQQVPTLILQAEASYHAGYDHCSVRFLKQAGVNVDFIKLEEVGVRGNGHMMMLEKNNQEIARVMADWLQKSVR
jgi:pimeloyl-ACP methyl ester carboxylesterase